MALVLQTPPAAEPLALAEVKLHLKVDTAADDALIANLIVAARQAADVIEHPKRVLGAVGQGRIAVDGGRADELDVRRERRDHEGDGVVRAGVDVERDEKFIHALRRPRCRSYP